MKVTVAVELDINEVAYAKLYAIEPDRIPEQIQEDWQGRMRSHYDGLWLLNT